MSGRGLVRGMFVAIGIGILCLPAMSYAAVGAPVSLSIVGSKYTNDTTPTFTWTAGSGATWYEYRIDNGAYVGLSNVLTFTTPALSNGWHSFAVRSHNNLGEVSGESVYVFEIDTVGPVVPAVSPTTAEEDEAVTFTVAPSGEAWTTSCTLYVGGVSVGAMTGDAQNIYSKSYTFTSEGNFSVHATCTDGDGNTTTGASRTIVIDEDDDNDELYVPLVSPSSATEDVQVTFSLTPTGDHDIVDCDLFVNGALVADMWEEGTTYKGNHTFADDGTYTVYARCTDDDGNQESGSSRTVTVSGVVTAEEGDLIKTSTSSAVYYYGDDGKRHAFPNEDVYYSWYNDFDDVITVSSTFMSSLTIGENVTIKPGTTTVKFATSAAVYAVAEGGVLRHYLTPTLVEADYGSDWSKNDLVIIPDVFYGNYTIGSDIDSSSDYDPDDAEDGVTSIDDNF